MATSDGARALSLIVGLLSACSLPAPPAALPPEPVYVTPVVLARDLDDPRALAASEQWVYFGDGGRLRRAPAAGGAVEDVHTFAGHVTSIAVAVAPSASPGAETLFVGIAGSGVHRVEGGRVVRVADATSPRSISLDASQVWFWDDRVLHVARDSAGTAVAPATATATPAFPLAGVLRPTGVDVGGTPVFHLAGGRRTRTMVADDTHLYYADGDRVRRHVKATGAAEEFAKLGAADAAVDLAIDATHVYWVDGALESVFRRAKAGGPAELLHNDAGGYSVLAVGPGAVYLCEIGGVLRRISSADRTHVVLTYSATSAFNKDGLALVAHRDALFLAVHAWRWDSVGPVVIGDGTPLPPLLPLGEVVRVPHTLPPIPAPPPEPGPTAWSSPYGRFAGAAATLDDDDRSRLDRWRERLPALLDRSIRAGTLPVNVIAEAPPDVLPATRARADAIAAAVREHAGSLGRVTVDARPAATHPFVTITIPSVELGALIGFDTSRAADAPETAPR